MVTYSLMDNDITGEKFKSFVPCDSVARIFVPCDSVARISGETDLWGRKSGTKQYKTDYNRRNIQTVKIEE